MRAKVAEINKDIANKNMNIPVGFGISTGQSMVGIFGSTIRKEYTALGQTVNLAARLEGLARADQILVCGETYASIKDHFTFEKIDLVNIRGIEEPMTIYNVIDVL